MLDVVLVRSSVKPQGLLVDGLCLNLLKLEWGQVASKQIVIRIAKLLMVQMFHTLC